MLARENRFHGHKSLGYVYRRGQAVRDRLMTIKYIDNPRRRQTRISVVVSRKVSKSAVKRNRIRRRLYELIRHRLTSLNNVYDIVIIVSSREVAEIDYQDLTASLDGLLGRTGLINAPTSDIISKKD